MIIRGIADAFTKLVAIFLWIAVIAFVIVLLMGLATAAENTRYGGSFLAQFLSIVGIQLVGLIFFIITMGMMAIFIDIRLTLIEIRDNSQGLVKRQDAGTQNQGTNGRIEPTITPVSMVSDSLDWQNTDQFGAIAKDASGNLLRDFIDANQSIFEAKGVTTKVVHGGKSWFVDLSGSKGTKSFNQSQLQSLIGWVDED